MIDPPVLESIHRDAEGDGSHGKDPALQDYLARNPEARALHADLGELFRLLDRVEAVEPPAGLKAAILDSIEMPSPARPRPRRESPRGRWPEFPLLRLAYVFLAGLIVGGGAYHLGSGWVRHGTPIDPAEIGGTMSRLEPATRSLAVAAAGLTGAIRVEAAESGITLDVDVGTEGPVEMVVVYPEDRLAFRGFTREESAVSSFAAVEGRVEVATRGDHRYTILFTREDHSETEIRFEFLSGGTRIHEGAVRLPGNG